MRQLHRKTNAAEEAQREAAAQKVVSHSQLTHNSDTTCVASMCRVSEIQCWVQAAQKDEQRRKQEVLCERCLSCVRALPERGVRRV